MSSERRLWIGNLCIAVVMFAVAVLPIAKTTSSWVIGTLAVLILVGFIFLFPWPSGNGSSRRLIGRTTVSGTGNRSQVAGDHSNQYMSNRDTNIEGGADNI